MQDDDGDDFSFYSFGISEASGHMRKYCYRLDYILFAVTKPVEWKIWIDLNALRQIS